MRKSSPRLQQSILDKSNERTVQHPTRTTSAFDVRDRKRRIDMHKCYLTPGLSRTHSPYAMYTCCARVWANNPHLPLTGLGANINSLSLLHSGPGIGVQCRLRRLRCNGVLPLWPRSWLPRLGCDGPCWPFTERAANVKFLVDNSQPCWSWPPMPCLARGCRNCVAMMANDQWPLTTWGGQRQRLVAVT